MAPGALAEINLKEGIAPSSTRSLPLREALLSRAIGWDGSRSADTANI